MRHTMHTFILILATAVMLCAAGTGCLESGSSGSDSSGTDSFTPSQTTESFTPAHTVESPGAGTEDEMVVTPEPATLSLAALACVGLAGVHWLRRRRGEDPERG